MILAVWRWAPQRRSLRLLSFLPLLGVVAQAVLGGITVLTHLQPGHGRRALPALDADRACCRLCWCSAPARATRAPTPLVRSEVSLLARVTAGVGAVVLALGTVVTGSGPHSGDAAHPTRFGFDPRSVSWLHADAVMLFLGLVVAVLVAVRLTHRRGSGRAGPGRRCSWSRWPRAWWATRSTSPACPRRWSRVHMLGACLLVAALTFGVLSLRRR